MLNGDKRMNKSIIDIQNEYKKWREENINGFEIDSMVHLNYREINGLVLSVVLLSIIGICMSIKLTYSSSTLSLVSFILDGIAIIYLWIILIRKFNSYSTMIKLDIKREINHLDCMNELYKDIEFTDDEYEFYKLMYIYCKSIRYLTNYIDKDILSNLFSRNKREIHSRLESIGISNKDTLIQCLLDIGNNERVLMDRVSIDAHDKDKSDEKLLHNEIIDTLTYVLDTIKL